MNIREGETDRVPLSVPCVAIMSDFTLIDCAGGYLLELLKSKNPPKLVLAIWHGEWRTDPFVIDPVIMIPRLEKHVIDLEILAKEKRKTSKRRKN